MSATVDMRPTKLFIGGISQNTTTKDMRAHFSQYGRVLDCVAMRRDDGRSRSFGYVTLDSPEAADKCIAKPQVLDGRVVDVKRAVPERAGKEIKTESDKLGKKKPRTPKAGEDLSAARDFSALLDEQAWPATTKLDADAPEFVPLGLEPLPEEELDADASSEDLSPGLEEFKTKLLTIGAPPGLSLPVTGLPTSIPAPPSAPPPPPPAAHKVDSTSDLSKQPTDDAQDYASTATPSTSPSQSPGTVSVDCAESDADDEEMPTELPSLGSALHASGNCRPCNFFSKGRCSNALDCEFCHMPHQKRKPTRQEKRDRKAAWLARQETKAEEKTIPLLDILTLPLRTAEESPKAAETSTPAAAAPGQGPVACLINFDDYSDFSDDDDEAAVKTSPHKKDSSSIRWSREDLLRVKVAMAKAC